MDLDTSLIHDYEEKVLNHPEVGPFVDAFIVGVCQRERGVKEHIKGAIEDAV